MAEEASRRTAESEQMRELEQVPSQLRGGSESSLVARSVSRFLGCRCVQSVSLRRRDERSVKSVDGSISSSAAMPVLQALQRTENLLNKYTKDYLKLKHDSLQRQRQDKEQIEERLF